jgi:hypothetical protein
VASILIGVRKILAQAVHATGAAQVVPWDVDRSLAEGQQPTLVLEDTANTH